MRELAAVFLLVAMGVGAGCAPGGGAAASGREDHKAARVALDRSLLWLEAHPTEPGRDKLGWVVLDGWAWYAFSAWHPDGPVRRKAAVQIDRRLRALRPPEQWTLVTLSQWATLMQIARLRGVDRTLYRGSLDGVDVAAILDKANSTTSWWTAELLRGAGFAVAADFSGTFIAAELLSARRSYVPSVRDAYRVFHEVMPAAGLGSRPPRALSAAQARAVRRALPGLVGVSRAAGDVDAAAEALTTAALLADRDAGYYRDGIAWLLGQQNEDGTYAVSGRARRSSAPDDFRHGVLVGSLAVLTSLPEVSRQAPWIAR